MGLGVFLARNLWECFVHKLALSSKMPEKTAVLDSEALLGDAGTTPSPSPVHGRALKNKRAESETPKKHTNLELAQLSPIDLTENNSDSEKDLD